MRCGEMGVVIDAGLFRANFQEPSYIREFCEGSSSKFAALHLANPVRLSETDAGGPHHTRWNSQRPSVLRQRITLKSDKNLLVGAKQRHLTAHDVQTSSFLHADRLRMGPSMSGAMQVVIDHAANARIGPLVLPCHP